MLLWVAGDTLAGSGRGSVSGLFLVLGFGWGLARTLECDSESQALVFGGQFLHLPGPDLCHQALPGAAAPLLPSPPCSRLGRSHGGHPCIRPAQGLTPAPETVGLMMRGLRLVFTLCLAQNP